MKIPPLCDVLTALALAFMIGVGAIVTGSEKSGDGFVDVALQMS